MSEMLDLSLYATPAGNGTLGMELAIDGIACGTCIARVEGAVKQVPGVTEARLNFTNRRLHVAWAEGAVKPAEIRRLRRAAITAIRSCRCVLNRKKPSRRADSCGASRWLASLP